MSEFKTPEKKVKIDETKNLERKDSGKYPKYLRQQNSYTSNGFQVKSEYPQDEVLFNNAFVRAQNSIYTDYDGKRIPPPPGDQIVSDLKNLEQYRRWGGLSKKMRSRKKQT